MARQHGTVSLGHVLALSSTACNSESLGLHKCLPLFVLELCFLRDVSISVLLKCGTALNIKQGAAETEECDSYFDLSP